MENFTSQSTIEPTNDDPPRVALKSVMTGIIGMPHYIIETRLPDKHLTDDFFDE